MAGIIKSVVAEFLQGRVGNMV
ncbi:MAG: hypothetical protein JWR69_1617, partial [Pedosphaera sp.]|nr:hypothetical protein [Pedosphaera sp.]